MKRQLIGATAPLIATTGYAQDYFDFDDIPCIDSEPTVQIDLNEAMLNFVKIAAN